MWKPKLRTKSENTLPLQGVVTTRRNFLAGLGTTAFGVVIAKPFLDPPVAGASEIERSLPASANTEAQPSTPIGKPKPIVRVGSEPNDKKVGGKLEELSSAYGVAKEWYEQDFTNPDQSLLMSLGQLSAATLVVGKGLALPLKALGIPTGNHGFDKMLANEEILSRINLKSLAGVVVGSAPVKEEIVFRALPSLMLNLAGKQPPKGQSRISPAVLSSAIFALAHNRGAEGNSVPVEQFAAGMALWRIHNSKGLVHAIATHAMFNGLVMGVSYPGIASRQKSALQSQLGQEIVPAIDTLDRTGIAEDSDLAGKLRKQMDLVDLGSLSRKEMQTLLDKIS